MTTSIRYIFTEMVSTDGKKQRKKDKVTIDKWASATSTRNIYSLFGAMNVLPDLRPVHLEAEHGTERTDAKGMAERSVYLGNGLKTLDILSRSQITSRARAQDMLFSHRTDSGFLSF